MNTYIKGSAELVQFPLVYPPDRAGAQSLFWKRRKGHPFLRGRRRLWIAPLSGSALREAFQEQPGVTNNFGPSAHHFWHTMCPSFLHFGIGRGPSIGLGPAPSPEPLSFHGSSYPWIHFPVRRLLPPAVFPLPRPSLVRDVTLGQLHSAPRSHFCFPALTSTFPT